jgi:hypothetical protein
MVMRDGRRVKVTNSKVKDGVIVVDLLCEQGMPKLVITDY